MQQGYYRAALLYSPVAWSQGALDFRSSQQTLADLSYSLNQPGQFCGSDCRILFYVRPSGELSMWFNGSLVNIRGTSDLEFTTAGPAVFRTRDVTHHEHAISAWRRDHVRTDILIGKTGICCIVDGLTECTFHIKIKKAIEQSYWQLQLTKH